MAEAKKRKNLGRGLSSLLGDEQSEDFSQLDQVRQYKTVPIEHLSPGRYQPRQHMDQGLIDDLAASIKDKGVLQPILVRRLAEDAETPFEIIAGERRWRASQLAQLHEVPIIIKDLDDQSAFEIALIENLQREDLSPLEEAEAYRRLMEEFDHTQEILAKSVGKSRSHVANTMRLLGLPDPVKAMLEDGSLSAGHARALLKATDPVALARQVAKKGLNVRQTEALVNKPDTPKPAVSSKVPAEKDADTIALERDLTNALGLKVEIKDKGRGGQLVLHYGTLEQLDDILHRLSQGDGAADQDFGDLPEPLEIEGVEEDLADLEAGLEGLTEEDFADSNGVDGDSSLEISDDELAAMASESEGVVDEDILDGSEDEIIEAADTEEVAEALEKVLEE